MSYAYGAMRGDYYRGDYYRGDPFWGFLKGIGKAAMGLVGLGGGGGVSQKALTGVVEAAVTKALPKSNAIMGKVGPIVTKIGKIPGVRGAAVAGLGAAAGYTAARMSGGSGGARRGRRMNVTNVKALRRSIRRCQGFSKLAKRVLRFTSPHPPRGRAVFKARRRKKVC